MKNAIILHGMPSKEGYYEPNRECPSNEHWLPWLQHQLIIKDILAQTPEMPRPYDPDYQEWLNVFNQFTINEDTILIGHSCGGGFLVRWLSENTIKVGKVILVAPWIDTDKILKSDFFNFKIDNNMSDKAESIVIFGSNNDDQEIKDSIDKLRNEIKNVKYKEFNFGHFVYSDMKTKEFPELLQEAIS